MITTENDHSHECTATSRKHILNVIFFIVHIVIDRWIGNVKWDEKMDVNLHRVNNMKGDEGTK